MYVLAVDGKLCRCSIEVLVSNFAFIITIDGVTVVSLADIEVEMIGTTSDLFIRSKADPEVSMGELLL